jgi:hypothetical protein
MAELAASLQSVGSENSPFERPLPTQQRFPDPSLEENAGVNISPDDTNAFPNVSLPLSFSSETADHLGENQKIESAMPRQNRELLAEAGQEYRAKAFELMIANVKANLEYANKFRKLRTSFEFIELSTTHARKQFELIMSQAAALGTFSQSLTMANAERMSPSVEKVFGERPKSGTSA